jgi:hypothetical protein
MVQLAFLAEICPALRELIAHHRLERRVVAAAAAPRAHEVPPPASDCQKLLPKVCVR